MKYCSIETGFKNSWEETIVAVWRRYPNPFSSHVLSEDTIERRVNGSRIFTKRLLLKTNPLPKWGQRFISARQVAIVEESILDRDQHTLVTYTRNIGCASALNVVEKCIYSSFSRERPSTSGYSTMLKREAWISSHLRGFAGVIQRFAVERYKHNASNASKGLACILARLYPVNLPSPSLKTAATKLTTSAHAVTDLVFQKIEDAATKTAKGGSAM